MLRFSRWARPALFVSVFCSSGVARAATFANIFQDDSNWYVPGTLSSLDATFNDPTAPTNVPTGTTGAAAGYPGVVSVFNPPFDTDQLVEIGVGGHLELKFAQPISVGIGKAVGVFTNTGFVDSPYGAEQVGDPATVFGGGQAVVRVSADGIHWKSLGLKNFKIPENFYINADPYATVAPFNPVLADFGKPVAGGLAAFDGETFQQVLDTLDGSAGGRWFNLQPTGLTSIQYIKFTEPAYLPAGSHLGIVAVSAANDHVSSPSLALAPATAISAVPLPSALYLGLAGLAVALFGSRKFVAAL